MAEDLISAADAAQRLGMSKKWVLALCAQGRIEGAHRIGNQWVIPAGAKIERVNYGRPSHTPLEIPHSPRKKR